MTYAGARGETAVQMSQVLRGASSDEALHVTFAEMMCKLNDAGGDGSEIAVENSLWGQDGAPLQPGFRDQLARHYGGVVNVVDFRHATEMARLTINRWVADKTRQKIRQLIPVGDLDADTRLALVNAIYFKALWASQFRKTATRGEPFYLEGGDKTAAADAPARTVPYLKASDYQAVDLDYRGGELSMLVLLPDQRDGLRDLETRLSPRMVSDCVAKMHLQNLEICLPRFKMTWGTVDLRNQLRALGMRARVHPFPGRLFRDKRSRAAGRGLALHLPYVQRPFVRSAERLTQMVDCTSATRGGQGLSGHCRSADRRDLWLPLICGARANTDAPG